jgi:hypothetical protein
MAVWAVATAVVTFGCGGSSDADLAVPGGYDAPATVELRGVVAGVVGLGVLIENHSADSLRNVEIVINPAGPEGGFRFRTASLPPNATQTFMASAFKTGDGGALNPMATKAVAFAVFADTPRGRGSWQGSY